MITRLNTPPGGTGGYNNTSALGLVGRPVGQRHNQYFYPVGTGGFAYGDQVLNPYSQTPDFEDANDAGNSGTQTPGVNEMSSGFETLCRDSRGGVILTGSEFSDVGTIEDMVIGEFLDRVFWDEQNFWTNSNFHISLNFGTNAEGRNSLSDPPVPNPPPTRYWAGLPAIGVSIDQADPLNSAVVLAGEECFTGIQVPSWGWQQMFPNANSPNAFDQSPVNSHNGPGVQSATVATSYAARQQIGNYLYVCDSANRLVHAINSNTMQVISSINLPDPSGIGIAPDNSKIFVSNPSNDSLSVVVTDPLAPDFHQEVARIAVGSGPRAVSVQPDYEDVFVCNFRGNSIAIVDPGSLTVRKTLTALISGPWDMVLTPRQQQAGAPNPFGFQTGIFFGYISNYSGNALLIYESGPSGPQGIGYDNVLGALPTSGQARDNILQPRGLCYSPFLNPQGFLASGVFAAHRDSDGFGRVSHIQFTNQPIIGTVPRQIPPGYFVPPGFNERTFDVVGTWGNTTNNRLAGFSPSDVTLSDLDVDGYQTGATFANFSASSQPPNPDRTGRVNSHSPVRTTPGSMFTAWVPDRLYVSFDDTDVIQVLDPESLGVVVNTIEGNGGPGVKRLVTYFEQ
jgi:hypothetical protein